MLRGDKLKLLSCLGAKSHWAQSSHTQPHSPGRSGLLAAGFITSPWADPGGDEQRGRNCLGWEIDSQPWVTTPHNLCFSPIFHLMGWVLVMLSPEQLHVFRERLKLLKPPTGCQMLGFGAWAEDWFWKSEDLILPSKGVGESNGVAFIQPQNHRS